MDDDESEAAGGGGGGIGALCGGRKFLPVES